MLSHEKCDTPVVVRNVGVVQLEVLCRVKVVIDRLVVQASLMFGQKIRRGKYIRIDE